MFMIYKKCVEKIFKRLDGKSGIKFSQLYIKLKQFCFIVILIAFIIYKKNKEDLYETAKQECMEKNGGAYAVFIYVLWHVWLWR